MKFRKGRIVDDSGALLGGAVDTTRIALSDEIIVLTEVLAHHVHDVWVGQRLRDGWRYGVRRDDERKEHPGLVSYEQLSEGDKAYDRGTALETVKALLALGYRIEKA